jgi:ArsR family transcriptional regulator
MSAARDTRLITLGAAFRAFADPTRLRILGLLAGGEICVCNIHECQDSSATARHLAYLRKQGLVLTRKDGLWVHYKIAPLDEPVMRVLMSAVTHAICHCDSIDQDRQRLASLTGCCIPAVGSETFECCAPPAPVDATRAKDRRRERRRDRRRSQH